MQMMEFIKKPFSSPSSLSHARFNKPLITLFGAAGMAAEKKINRNVEENFFIARSSRLAVNSQRQQKTRTGRATASV
jgi:hypothetical protein